MQNHKNDKSKEMNKGTEKNGHGLKHGLMMMLCCLIPILIIAGLPLFGFKGSTPTWLIFLLMPLMHVGMMFSMKKGKHKDSFHDDKTKEVKVKVEK
ncbi:hypothetical protein [Sporosalibacterium faouarense]|uniref:hypothetical protein n=1 Tax=Sporosalibacterium faouarense TaxID=516123 RepID=UPI001FAEACAA|nr:hypothetical protein [Sporosalibacterium faouarense]